MELGTNLLHVTSIAMASYVAVAVLIPLVGRRLPVTLSGKDLCKRGTPAGDVPM